jgi:hypothetical protein
MRIIIAVDQRNTLFARGSRSGLSVSELADLLLVSATISCVRCVTEKVIVLERPTMLSSTAVRAYQPNERQQGATTRVLSRTAISIAIGKDVGKSRFHYVCSAIL